jgi:hypothetical protein
LDISPGDIVCLKNPQAHGGGRPLIVYTLTGEVATARVIRQGIVLTYVVRVRDLELLVRNPVGPINHIRFEGPYWRLIQAARDRCLADMKRRGLA